MKARTYLLELVYTCGWKERVYLTCEKKEISNYVHEHYENVKQIFICQVI